MNTSTQSKPSVNPGRRPSAKKQLWISSEVHDRLRRRVGAENMMGRDESLETLATKLLAKSLDDLPGLPHIPPAA